MPPLFSAASSTLIDSTNNQQFLQRAIAMPAFPHGERRGSGEPGEFFPPATNLPDRRNFCAK
jgi:hypothetical protein